MGQDATDMQGAPQSLYMPVVPFREARRRLRVSAPAFNALVWSGLLGEITTRNEVFVAAIEHYERYGTQWRTEDRPELPDRMLTAEYIQAMPPPPDAGDNRYPGVQTKMYIVREGMPSVEEARETDTGWIAQFYLTPNPYCWPAPVSMGMVAPLLLKLPKARAVPGAKLPTKLYPDPYGSLAMAMVTCARRGDEEPLEAAYDVVAPILDELSVRYDQPLPIAHSLVVNIPSGLTTMMFPTIPDVRTIAPDDPLLPSVTHPELRDAAALYREGASSNNPFHQFLALWKAYENACEVRGEWRKRHKRPVAKVREEVFPEAFGFRGYEGLTFDEVKQKLERPHRVALAHGANVRGGKPKTAASAEDVMGVSYSVPLVRYMARVTVENVEATLASTGEASGA
ncbi:MAG: hypothetical protein M3R38_23730 [Actinomycetota bacterium]|nr:hypothetical protein [Actinomycetota bacterium]